MAYTALVLPATGASTLVDTLTFGSQTGNAQLIKLLLGDENVGLPLKFGQALSAGSISVVLSSDHPALTLATSSAVIGHVRLVDQSGAQIDWVHSTTGTLRNVTATTTATNLLDANSLRKGAMFFNDSTADLFIAFSNATPSATVCSFKMAPGSLYELPMIKNFPYRGVVKGVWSAANGACRSTEFT
jgi:hypothetical protein